jgi:DNA-binding response OmpR family regulator
VVSVWSIHFVRFRGWPLGIHQDKKKWERPKILIVEDKSDLSDLLSVHLGAVGFDTSQAHNSRKGITKALAERPDLIIADLHLPDMNPLEAIKILKKNPTTSGIPIVALSATSLGDWRNKNPKD